MTFDLEAARKAAAKTGTIPCASKAVFVAALDEIAKQEQGISNLQTALVARDQMIAAQAKRIAELEAPMQDPGSQPLDDKAIDQLNDLIKVQAKRIAELEEASAFECRDLYETIAKQRAALKKLGAKYHEQREGRRSDARLYDASQTAMASQIMKLQEALMEETAWSMFNAETQSIRQDPPYQDVVERYERETRQQLRREGLL